MLAVSSQSYGCTSNGPTSMRGIMTRRRVKLQLQYFHFPNWSTPFSTTTPRAIVSIRLW